MSDRLRAFSDEPDLQQLLAADPSVLDRAERLAQTVTLGELRRMVSNTAFDSRVAPMVLPGAADAASLKARIETYDPKWLALYLLEARVSDSAVVHHTPQNSGVAL